VQEGIAPRKPLSAALHPSPDMLTHAGAGTKGKFGDDALRVVRHERGLGCAAPRCGSSRASRPRMGQRAAAFRQPLAVFTASVSFGTISNRSPTTPSWATSKIGASASLLMAMMKFEPFIPTRC